MMDINQMSRAEMEELQSLLDLRKQDRSQIMVGDDLLLPFGMDAWNERTKRYLAWRRGFQRPLFPSEIKKFKNIPNEINVNGNVLDWQADYGYYQMRNEKYQTIEEHKAHNVKKSNSLDLVDTSDHQSSPSFECTITKDFDEALAAFAKSPPFHPPPKRKKLKSIATKSSRDTCSKPPADLHALARDTEPFDQSAVDVHLPAAVNACLQEPPRSPVAFSPVLASQTSGSMQIMPTASPQPSQPPPRARLLHAEAAKVATAPVTHPPPSTTVPSLSYAFPPFNPFNLPKEQPSIVHFSAARNLPLPLPVRVVSPEPPSLPLSPQALLSSGTPLRPSFSPVYPSPTLASVHAPNIVGSEHCSSPPVIRSCIPLSESQTAALPPRAQLSGPPIRPSAGLHSMPHLPATPCPHSELIAGSVLTSHYRKGSRVKVVRGTYAGLSGVVMGEARAGVHALLGQWSVRVRMHNGRRVPIILASDFLTPG